MFVNDGEGYGDLGYRRHRGVSQLPSIRPSPRRVASFVICDGGARAGDHMDYAAAV